MDKVIEQLEEARQKIRQELRQDAFSIHAKFSGDYPCLCGKSIQQGEEITRVVYCNRWIHTECADIDRSDYKWESKAFGLIRKLAEQARDKEAVWRDDLLELAKLAYLGKWSIDYWLEDTILTENILTIFGLHKLTKGWRFSSDKAKQKYAQKIEKEFAKRKGWICRRCKRLIWVEKSVTLGIGPICRKHVLEESQPEAFEIEKASLPR